MCETMFLMLFVIGALIGVLSRRKGAPVARRRIRSGYHDDTYESPFGLVDDPEDEWLEYAIMDDMLDDDW